MPENTVRISHPDFPDDVREVPKDAVKEWTEQGWETVGSESTPKRTSK